jgi:hypothetical protein
MDSTSLTTQLSANWTVSTDEESNIARYWYAIGTTPGGTNAADWVSTSNGSVTSVTRSNLSLITGVTYYFTVKAENGVSLQSDSTNSDGQFVEGANDMTPPSDIATVNDGTASQDIDSTSLTTQLSANWTAATDEESNIRVTVA